MLLTEKRRQLEITNGKRKIREEESERGRGRVETGESVGTVQCGGFPE
jgi:hypothetical protein